MADPPAAGVSGVEGGYSEVVATTDGGGTLNYRAVAFSPDDRALAASPVRAVTTKAVKNLGPLAAGPDGGATAFGWTPFGGGEACFSSYKLAYSESDATPGYLEGSAVAWVGSDQAAGEAFVTDLAPGTYWFRMQAIRATSLGKFVVGQTDTVAYTVP